MATPTGPVRYRRGVPAEAIWLAVAGTALALAAVITRPKTPTLQCPPGQCIHHTTAGDLCLTGLTCGL